MGPSSVHCLQLCLCLSVSQKGTTEGRGQAGHWTSKKGPVPIREGLGRGLPPPLPPTPPPTRFPSSLTGSPRELQPLLLSEPGQQLPTKSSCLPALQNLGSSLESGSLPLACLQEEDVKGFTSK